MFQFYYYYYKVQNVFKLDSILNHKNKCIILIFNIIIFSKKMLLRLLKICNIFKIIQLIEIIKSLTF
jgi:hypothetical protein